MHVCKKCAGMCAWTVLILGVVFLLRDLNVWNFWNIQWWTALFLLFGISGLASKSCPDCQALTKGKK